MNDFTTVSTLEQLDKAIDFLRSYRALAGNRLSDSDDFDLSSCITSLVLMKKDAEDIQSKVAANDPFDGQLYLVHAADLGNLLNIATYDTYGKLYAKRGGPATFQQYESAVNQDYSLSESAAGLGYDLIFDLYDENERAGYHKPDGTFNSNL